MSSLVALAGGEKLIEVSSIVIEGRIWSVFPEGLKLQAFLRVWTSVFCISARQWVGCDTALASLNCKFSRFIVNCFGLGTQRDYEQSVSALWRSCDQTVATGKTFI